MPRYCFWIVGGLIALGAAFPAILWNMPMADPAFGNKLARGAFRFTVSLLPPILVWQILKPAIPQLQPRLTQTLVLLFAACYCAYLHFMIVDCGFYFPTAMFSDNTAWQKQMMRGILALDPMFIPHSYRFLGDSYISVLQWLSGSFQFARSFYRVFFYALLYAVIFRFACLYLNGLSALAVVLIHVLLFPVTNFLYAGQYADPASHLSFALCFYCLAIQSESGFLTSLIVGIFAKESVVIMAVCRAFYGSNRLRAAVLASLYLAIGIGVVMSIRLFVNRGSFAYGAISGVDPTHVLRNLKSYTQWGPQYFFSIGVLIPGAALGWRLLNWPFRLTSLTMLAGLIVSSAVFSWLHEVRNLVPALAPLAIINLKYVETYLQRDSSTTLQTLP